MRKIFVVLIGLLCACNSNNEKKTTTVSANKQLLNGLWQLDSIDLTKKLDTLEIGFIGLYLMDEGRYQHIQFGIKDEKLTEYDANDSSTGPFKWQGDSAIVLTDLEPNEKFLIKKLTANELVLFTEDTLSLFFKRVK